MTAHLARAHLPELIGWAVVLSALLALVCRVVSDGGGALVDRLYPPVRRAAAVLAAYGRSRAAAMRQPRRAAHRHRRPHPRLAAAVLALHLHLTHYIPGGTSR